MGIFSVGAIGLDLKVNGFDLRKQIKSESKASTSLMENMFSSSFKKIGAMAATAFSIAAIGKFTSSCLKLGSDLTEVQNVVDTAFPKMSAQVDSFAKNAMESFGLSETVAKRYMGTFGAMSKAFGFAEKDAYEMSATLTGLAGDVASFYNLDTSEAYTKLKSVFTGETETLKDLGVVMTQSALDQYALANGYGKTTSAMSEQEKVSLRLAFVTDQLSLASGDFIRTQDSWANQTRVLALRFDALRASLGKGFIAVFTPIVKGINWVLANLQPLADSFASLMEMLTGSSGTTGGGGSALAETSTDLSSATDAVDSLGSGLSDTGKKGESAAKKIKKAFAGVDTINKLSFDSGTSGSDSDSGGSSGGSAVGGSVAEAVDFPKATQQANVFSGMVQGIIDEFKNLADIFKIGFKIGFGDSLNNIQKIKNAVASIGKSIKEIFTAPEVINAASIWANQVIFALGEVIGSAASIATTMAALLTSSVANYLQSNTEFIKDRIITWFDISRDIANIIGNFSVVLADIAKVFVGSTAIQIGSNLIQSVANGALNSLVLIQDISKSIISMIAGPIIENKNTIKSAIEEFLHPIADVTGIIADSLTDWDSFVAIAGSLAAAFVGFKTAVALTASSGAIGTLATGISVFFSGIAEGSGLLVSFSALFPKLGVAISSTWTAFTTFFYGVKEGAGVITSLQAVLPSSISSFSSLGSTMLGLVNPVTIIISSIAALTAGFVYLYTTSDSFREKINGAFNNVAQNIKGVISGMVSIIQTIWSQGVQPVVSSTMAAFQNLWNNGLAVFVENVSMFVINIINLIMSIWNNAINPFVNLLLNTFLPVFTTVWSGMLTIAQPIIEKIMSFVNMFMEVLNALTSLLSEHVLPIFKTIFDGLSQTVQGFYNFAKPILDLFISGLGLVVDFATNSFLAPLQIIFKTVIDVVKAIADPIGQVLDGVKDMLQGIIDFVSGVFSGDWSKAWAGVKKTFSGMWTSLKGIVSAAWNSILALFGNAGKIFSGVVTGITNVFKNIVNCMLDGINRVIRVPFDKINGLLNSIRSIDIPIIGQPFLGLWGKNPLPVPQIPKLAEGAYVGANQPQLAMIGDNKRYGEIVAPENKMLEMINTALQMQRDQGSASGIRQIISLLKQLITLIANLNLSVDIDRKKLAILLRQAEKELEMIGG